jgi:hypothetical protein
MTNYPFWTFNDKGVASVKPVKLCRFLVDNGFGNYTDSQKRTDGTTLIRSVEGFVQVHNPRTIKRFLTDCVVSDTKLDDLTRDEVLDVLIKLSEETLKKYLHSLLIYSSLNIDEYEDLGILLDAKGECFIPFRNGVVSITANKIEILEKNALVAKGKFWETAIINKTITVDDVHTSEQPNLFRDFIRYALKRDVDPSRDGSNDILEGTDTKDYQNRFDAFETGFGYLLHSYNPPDDARIVIFIDADASPKRVNGGNGKSVSMDAVKHFKQTVFLDGKTFQNSGDAQRFNFSLVKPDTRFCYINDLNPNFDLTSIFSQITDDMTVEMKRQSKIVIPKEKKPKLGITTNYIVGGVGTSFERRSFTVEFGNFFSRCNVLGIKPSEVIGKMLFDDFDDEDWNAFYNYGFHCIQRYLREGLLFQDTTDYRLKVLIKEIEGTEGDGTLVKWLQDWIEKDRIINNYHTDGISIDELWKLFAKEFPIHADTQWDKKTFGNKLYQYVMSVPELDYNPHKLSKGNSRTDRRWRKGGLNGKGQEDWVLITHIDDSTSVDLEELESLDYFQSLAA